LLIEIFAERMVLISSLKPSRVGGSARNAQSVHREFLAVMRGLDAEVLALCILHGAQHSIGQRENYRDAALRVGKLIADECWAKGITRMILA
jgi:hypothetical protein